MYVQYLENNFVKILNKRFLFSKKLEEMFPTYQCQLSGSEQMDNITTVTHIRKGVFVKNLHNPPVHITKVYHVSEEY